jgi:hypothetical protein
MTWKELESVISAMGENRKTELNDLRLIMYSTFQSQSTKKLKPTDILSFEWDNNSSEVDKDNIMSKEEALKILNSI